MDGVDGKLHWEVIGAFLWGESAVHHCSDDLLEIARAYYLRHWLVQLLSQLVGYLILNTGLRGCGWAGCEWGTGRLAGADVDAGAAASEQ
ncbi:MAG TPA: hypothetical protein VE152_13145 [Acidimicrobiales bacterium]|jgi:hypothetical protein|nr:hypothetical protein [Acidimicrobiales bacterium]